MRINYYCFPEGIDADTRFKSGADNLNGNCLKGIESCCDCPFNTGRGWYDCEHFQSLKSENIISGLSVTAAKKLLKQFGGATWTAHIDRDGGCFEITEIKLAGNNSRFKYNRHL